MSASSAFQQLNPRIQHYLWSEGWGALRAVQELAIPKILPADRDVIVAASTASGKTEAAFLPALTYLLGQERPGLMQPDTAAARLLAVMDTAQETGRFMAYDGQTNAGFINFLRYPRDLSLHLDYLMVRPEYRGRGVGEVILRKFREWLHRNYAWVKYAASEVTSQKSLHLMNKVFGPPLYMSNGVRLVTLDEAMRALPASMETNEHGGLDAEGHIDVVHWIGVGRAPKDHPWVERAAGGASGTARRGHARGRAGRSSGRVYPSERSPAFIASLPAERRASRTTSWVAT